MKFLFALSTLLSVGASLASTVPKKDACVSVGKAVGTYNGVTSAGCTDIVTDCVNQLDKGCLGTDDLWSVDSCVAAATCTGPENIVTVLKCARKTSSAQFPDRTSTSNLDYELYASIVGDCAWKKGGCPITKQNYVDFIFGTLSEIGASQYPSYDEVVKKYWNPIKKWANTGNTIPYTNFNDWLHFGNNL